MDIREIRDELARRRDQYRECRDERLVVDDEGCTRTPGEGHEFHMYTSYQGSYAAMQSAVEWLDRQIPPDLTAEAIAFERMGERMSTSQDGLVAEAEYAAEHAPGYVMIAGAPYPHKDLNSMTVETLLEAVAGYYYDKKAEWEKHNQVATMLLEIDAVENAYEMGGNKSEGIRSWMGLLYDRYSESALCLDERLQGVQDVLEIIRGVVESTRGK